MCDHCLKSHVLCELKIPAWNIHQWANLNGPVGQLGWDRSRPCLGWDLSNVQQVGRAEKRQSCSVLNLFMATRHIRIPLPTSSSYKFLCSLLGFGGGSMSKHDSTLVSAPPGAPVGG